MSFLGNAAHFLGLDPTFFHMGLFPGYRNQAAYDNGARGAQAFRVRIN